MPPLNFTCSHLAPNDEEGSSPCGRPTTWRDSTESQCLGHWVAAWLGAPHEKYGGKRLWTSVYLFAALASFTFSYYAIAGTIMNFSADPVGLVVVSALAPLYLAFSCLSALALNLDHPGWGRWWLMVVPTLGSVIAIDRILVLQDAMKTNPTGMDGVRPYLDVTIAVLLVLAWARLLLVRANSSRWASVTLGVTLAYFLTKLVVVARYTYGIAPAADKAMLLVGAALGIVVALSGSAYLRKVANRLRV